MNEIFRISVGEADLLCWKYETQVKTTSFVGIFIYQVISILLFFSEIMSLCENNQCGFCFN